MPKNEEENECINQLRANHTVWLGIRQVYGSSEYAALDGTGILGSESFKSWKTEPQVNNSERLYVSMGNEGWVPSAFASNFYPLCETGEQSLQRKVFNEASHEFVGPSRKSIVILKNRK